MNKKIIMTEKNITYQKISVELETGIYKDIKKIAFEEETSMKEIINTYLADQINKNKGQTKLD